jgi:hypothetical protein
MSPALLTPLLLAQADAPPADFAGWLANAAYLALLSASILGGLVALKNLREKPVETPQPFRVREDHDFTPIPMHQALEARVGDLAETMEVRFREAAVASSHSRKLIYDELRTQGQALAAVRQESATNTAQLGRVDLKIDRILERLPRA